VEKWDPERVAGKAWRVLEEYPLCDRCLGRLFARLGYGWANPERGDALKRVVVMGVHALAREEGPDRLERVARNIGGQAAPLYEKLLGKPPEPAPCYVCRGTLDRFLEETAEKAYKLARAYDIERFVVGARVDRDVLEREEEIRGKHQLPYGESIRAEIRREIGKRLAAKGLTPDFDEPEATILVHYPSGMVDVQVNSLLLKGRYWKLARYISQAYWPGPDGPRYFSVEQAAWGLLSATGAERLVVHAAGREDVDARMLGTGRPLIIELKQPRRRRLPLEELEKAANSRGKGLVEFAIEGVASRREIRHYKGEASRSRKTYKALIALEDPLTPGDIESLEEFFRDRLVLQRTPRRVLHRRPDILRRRTVYSVRCRLVQPQIMECLVQAEGGLYIKELVSGDEGRTTPSFSEVLGVQAVCVELDVAAVELEAAGTHHLKPRREPVGRGESRHGQASEGLQAQDKEATAEEGEGEGRGP